MKTSYSLGLGIPGLRFADVLSRASRFLGLMLAFVSAGLAGCGGGGSISEPDPAPAPTLEIRTGLDGAATGPFQVSFVFSNDVAGFSQSSLRLQRGNVVDGSFRQVSAREFAVTINPQANAMGVTVLRVPVGSFSTVGSLLTNPITYEFSKAFDTIKPVTEPTASFGHVMQGVSGRPPALVTITFDIDVQPFTLDKLEISGATASAFNRVSAREYTLVLTPPPQVTGVMVVNVPEGAVTGAVPGGVPSTRPSSYGILYIVPPGG
jgi:hypothetical protein